MAFRRRVQSHSPRHEADSLLPISWAHSQPKRQPRGESISEGQTAACKGSIVSVRVRFSWLIALGSPFLTSVISRPGTNLQFAVSGSLRLHLHRSISAFGLRGYRLVANRVLIADVVGNFPGDGIHLVNIPRKK